MPQAANLVVKNGANVDKTFTLVTPAAGDGGVAVWALKEGPISSVFPQFTASAQAKPGQRALKLKVFVPSSYTDSVTGTTIVKNRAEANTSVVIPNDFPEALKPDFVAYCTNLYKTALVQALWQDAVPAT